MSFFTKLKERLFKSSSKLEEGLETILDSPPTGSGNQELKSKEQGHNTDSKNITNDFHYDQEEEKQSNLDVEKRSLFAKIRNKKATAGKRVVVDDKLLESLEELLISADLGVTAATRISAALAQHHYGRKLGKDEIKSALAAQIKQILAPVAVPISISKSKLQIVLVVGVNGSGKTTTIGKLAHQFKVAGKNVKIVAGDTFRAAAIEQLEVWGERADVPVLKTSSGSDPAALAYDSMVSAQQDGSEILIIDTAGRLQNKSDLMEELAKIVRVLQKVDEEAPQSTLLVLDASIGQNAISQVEIFQKTANITGLVMTKLDGSAKGGILVALADRFKLPIHAIGIGEGIDDLQPFDPNEFTIALTGLEEI